MKKLTHYIALMSVATVSLLAMTSVQAQSSIEGKGINDPWRFQVSPYVWGAGMQGDVRPLRNAPTAHVKQSFFDVLEHLDAAVFLMGTARKGRFVMQGDYTYASTSAGASLPMNLSANAEVRQTSLTLTGGYNWQITPQSSVDLLAGGRYWHVKAGVSVPNVLDVQSKTTFVDPIVALRWYTTLAPRWSTLAYADLGGFGIGSDLTWQLMGSVNYQVRDDIYVSLGYRYLSVDYQGSGKRLDFQQHGIMTGVTFRF